VLQDFFKFCCFALLLQICLFTLYLAKAHQHAAPVQQTFTRVINVLIASVPTGAPTVVIAALAYCMLHLQSQHIEVLIPEKVKTIADVEVACFDKTGTLTGTMVSPFLTAYQLLPCLSAVALRLPFYCCLLVMTSPCFPACQHLPFECLLAAEGLICRYVCLCLCLCVCLPVHLRTRTVF